jgi:hypothetical protein
LGILLILISVGVLIPFGGSLSNAIVGAVIAERTTASVITGTAATAGMVKMSLSLLTCLLRGAPLLLGRVPPLIVLK